jgi:hypothetical protein
MAIRPWLSALFAFGVLAALLQPAPASAQRRKTGAKPAAAQPQEAAEPEAAAPSEPDAVPAPPSPGVEPAAAPPAAEEAAPAAVPAPPAATETKAPEADANAEHAAEVAALQQELAAVMDDLVQARTRVAVLGKSLFKTKVRLKLDNRAAPDQLAVRVLIWLDGAPVFSGDGSSVRDPERALWEGFAAPGPHVITVEVEQRARDDEAYRYTLRDSYRFVVNRERRTDVRVVLDDDSDMAEDFKDDEEGSYEVQTRFEVRAVALNEE